MNLLDSREEEAEAPCLDCGEKYKQGGGVSVQLADGRIAWQGCMQCWLKRTDPNANPMDWDLVANVAQNSYFHGFRDALVKNFAEELFPLVDQRSVLITSDEPLSPEEVEQARQRFQEQNSAGRVMVLPDYYEGEKFYIKFTRDVSIEGNVVKVAAHARWERLTDNVIYSRAAARLNELEAQKKTDTYYIISKDES